MRIGAPMGHHISIKDAKRRPGDRVWEDHSTTSADAQLLVDVVAGSARLLVARWRRRQIGYPWLTMPDRGWQWRRTNRIWPRSGDRRLFARVLGARGKCQKNSGQPAGCRHKRLRLRHDQLRSSGNDGIVFRTEIILVCPGILTPADRRTPSSLGITPRFRLSRDTSAVDGPRL
jgi:hypothetical protein